jgi:hypothetical protein
LPVWYFVAKDEGHGFSKKSNYDYRFYATVMLVKRVFVELIGDFAAIEDAHPAACGAICTDPTGPEQRDGRQLHDGGARAGRTPSRA